MKLFDGHIHLADERFIPDFDPLLARMAENRVAGGVVICDPGDLHPDHGRASRIVREHGEFVLAAACHPQNALHFSPAVQDVILRLIRMPECTCIGETGLDYYDNQSTREQQIAALNWHLDLAYEEDMPVQLHVRNAHGDLLTVLRDRKRRGCLPRGTMHCFTRSRDLAREYLRLGMYISVAGPVTFTNANKLIETVRDVPADRLLIETDSPWVSPEPHRGMRAEPAFLIDTFRRVAEIRSADPEALSEQLWRNAMSAFDAEKRYRT